MTGSMRLTTRRAGVRHLVACLVLALALATTALTAWADEAATPGRVIDPVRHADEYSAVLYNSANGLPTSEANDIVQSDEGFIWIGSYSGLIRYDGTTFERMDSSMGIGGVACLHVDEQDRLWIGTNDSGLAMLDDDNLRWWGVADGLGSNKITDIEEDGSGTIYVGTSAGISVVNPDLTISTAADYRLGTAYIDSIRKGAGNLVYCLTSTDDYFAMRKGLLVEYINHNETSIPGMTCITADLNDPGSLYVGTEDSLLYHGNPKRDATAMEVVDVSPLNNVVDIEQIGDQVWLCGRTGIGLLDDEGFHYLGNLPLNGSVNQVIQDYEGNLWFTSSRQGVMKLVPNRFMDLSARYGLGKMVVNSTCMHDGQLFLGTDTGLVVIGADGPVTSLPLTSATTASGADLGESDLLELLDGCRIRSVLHDSQDRLWISTWRGVGLIRYDHGTVVAFNEEDGFVTTSIAAQTLDLNAGQLIDRIGVMLGLHFPCGKELEKLALSCTEKVRARATLKGMDCCLSGGQNIAEKYLKEGKSPEFIARFAMEFVTSAVVGMSEKLKEQYGDLPFVYAGGVMSDSIIRENLQRRFDCVFAKPEFSSDNAAGTAVLAFIKDQ